MPTAGHLQEKEKCKVQVCLVVWKKKSTRFIKVPVAYFCPVAKSKSF